MDAAAARADALTQEFRDTIRMMQIVTSYIRPAGLGTGRVRDFQCCETGHHSTQTDVMIEA